MSLAPLETMLPLRLNTEVEAARSWAFGLTVAGTPNTHTKDKSVQPRKEEPLQESQMMNPRCHNAGWFLLPKWLRKFRNTHRSR